MRFSLYLAGALVAALAAGPELRVAEAEPIASAGDSTDVVATTPDTSAVDEVPPRDAFDLLNEYVLKRRVEPELVATTRTGLSWAILPTISYNPVYGAAFGLMATGAGRRGSGVRYSSLSVSGNISTTGQVQAQVRGDVFSPSGTYLTKADFRFLDTKRSTWGLGSLSEDQEEYPMEFTLYRVYATFYRVVSGPVFVGLGYHYDEFTDIVDQRAQQGEETPFTSYSGGPVSNTVASGVSINLLGDTRDNLVNASSGYYLSMSFRSYLTTAGSDHNWQEMWAEMRVYPHVPKRSRHVLGFWLYTWLSFGPAPYLNQPSNGWDTYGRGARGYLQGRIRGSSQVYVETEYRRALSRDGLWGAVVFVNLTCTTNPDSQTFGRGDPGVGVGLRMKFNKHSNTNLTIDHGWGRDGSRGFFLGMSEVF
jgi:hypothetical protein